MKLPRNNLLHVFWYTDKLISPQGVSRSEIAGYVFATEKKITERPTYCSIEKTLCKL